MQLFAFPGLIALAALASLILPAPVVLAEDIDQLPVTVTFVMSGGSWEEPGDVPDDGKQAPPTAGQTVAEPAPARRGYYKLVAVRQPDRTAKVYLQQIAATETGPELVDSVELDEITALKPYVTDIRPEDSTGVSRQPGLFATVYLKTDPTAVEPDSWTVLIDELGEIRVERATN